MIHDVLFKGIEGGNPAASGSFSTTGCPNVFANDDNNVTGDGTVDMQWDGTVADEEDAAAAEPVTLTTVDNEKPVAKAAG